MTRKSTSGPKRPTVTQAKLRELVLAARAAGEAQRRLGQAIDALPPEYHLAYRLVRGGFRERILMSLGEGITPDKRCAKAITRLKEMAAKMAKEDS